MKNLASTLLLSAVLISCQAQAPVDPGPWPQWRGPDGSGVLRTGALPESWSDDSSNLRWRVEIPGQGNSSPIVGDGRVYVTTAISDWQGYGGAKDEPVERRVLAVDLDSGELLWQTSVSEGLAVRKHHQNTYAGPTPATDGRRVYGFFGDVLVAVDVQDGSTAWEKVVDPEYNEFAHYGAGSSVVLTDDAVILFQDREMEPPKPGWLGAFDKESGDELWRVEWDDNCCSYVTPLLLRRAAGTEILITHAGHITSYSAANGEVLWQHDLVVNQPVASSIIEGDLLVVFSGAHGVRIGTVMRLSGAGKETQVEPLWATTQVIPQTSSPVLYNGLIFRVVEKGVMVCVDALTGRPLWRNRLPGFDGYQASLAAGDGKVYAFGHRGTMRVIAAEPQFRLLAENQLGGGGNASPALLPGSLVLRTGNELVRIDAESAAPAEPAAQEG